MGYQFIIYDKPEDGIARITLNRPEALNALTMEMIDEIYAAAQEAADDPEVAVLIYRGAGRAFCAGRDFKYSGKLQTEDPAGWYAWRRRYKDFGPQTWTHPKATIAQIHGYALGGGHSIAAGCDIGVASEDARFGYPEQRYGQLAGEWHVWNWLMGPKKTKEYLFTGRNFGAREALMFGLINQVVPLEKLEETVVDMAQDIATIERKNPGYIRANKIAINRQHPDLMYKSTLNPHEPQDRVALIEYTVNQIETQEEFFTMVARDGIETALGKMHEGFSSRT